MAVCVALKQTVHPPSHEKVCFDSCRSFIALGDGNGIVWLLHPVGLTVLSQLTLQAYEGQKEGIQRISVSPDEQLLACVTSLGDITVLQVSSGRVLCRVQEHREHSVTSIVWRTEAADTRPTGLYVGDDAGLVTLVNVPKSKVAALFQTPCIRLLQLDSGITQLDYLNDQLVVSTYCATFICDTKQELFTQVGEKLRQGKFGGCLFYVRDSMEMQQALPDDRNNNAGSSATLGRSFSYELHRSRVAGETLGEVEEHFHLINNERKYIDSSVSFFLGDIENPIQIRSDLILEKADTDKLFAMESIETCEEKVIYHSLDTSKSNSHAEENSSIKYPDVNSSFGIDLIIPARSSGRNYNCCDQMIESSFSPTSPSQKRPSYLSQHGRHFLEEELRVFSGRPKSRMWESDLSGRVIRTHQLAGALAATPLPVYDLHEDGKLCADSYTCHELVELSGNTGIADLDAESDTSVNLNCFPVQRNGRICDQVQENTGGNNESCKANNCDDDSPKPSENCCVEPLFLVFNQILRFQNRYLLLVCSRGVYGIDPLTSTVVFFLQVSVLGEVSVSGNSLLLSSVSGEVMRVCIVPPELAVLSLHTLKLFRSCAHLATQHLSLFQHSEVLNRVKKVVIRDILSVVDDPCLVESLEALKNDTFLHNSVSKSSNSIINISNNTSSDVVGPLASIGPGHNMSVSMYVKPSFLAAQSCPATPPASRKGRASPKQPSSTGYLTPASGYYSRPLFGYRGYGSVPPLAEGEPVSSALHDFMGSVTSNMTSSLLAAVTTKLTAVANQTRGLHESSRTLAGNFRGGLLLKKGQNRPEEDQTSLEKNVRAVLKIGEPAPREFSLPQSPIEDGGTDIFIETNDENLQLRSILNDTSNVTTSFQSNVNREGNHLFNRYDADVSVDRFEELVVERKSRRRNKKGVGHKDKGKGMTNMEDKSQIVDTFSCEENHEDSTVLTTTLATNFFNFARLVTELERSISSLNTDSSRVSILSCWLKEYIKLLSVLTSAKGVVAADRIMDRFMQQSIEVSDSRSITKQGLQRGITLLLTYCLEYRNSLQLPKLDSWPTLPELFSCDHHPVMSEYDRKLDSFFAALLKNSFDLVNYESIVNSLSSLGLEYSPRLWLVLLFQVTGESSIGPTKGDFILDLFESLDFTRSQKLVFFRHYVEANQLETLVDAAVKFHHPSVVFDVLLISKYFAIVKSFKNGNLNQCLENNESSFSSSNHDLPPSCETDNLQTDGLLYAYLLTLSKKYNVCSLYVKYWCGVRELQHDLVSCILHKLSPLSRTCTCGASLPQTSCCSLESSVPLVSLLATVLRGVVHDPFLLANLCYKHSYWSGYYNLALRYQLTTLDELLATGVLQSGCSNTLGLLFEALDQRHGLELFTTLATMSEGVSTTNEFRCTKCHILVNVASSEYWPDSNAISTSVDGLHLRCDEASESPRLDSLQVSKAASGKVLQDCCISNDPGALLRPLWLRAVQWALGRVGGRLTLKLLQQVAHRLPPSSLPPEVYSMCLLCAATEQHTSSHRRSLLATACKKPVLPLKEEQNLRTLAVESLDLGRFDSCVVPELNKSTADAVHSSPATARRRSPATSLPMPTQFARPFTASLYGLTVDTKAGHCGVCQLSLAAHCMLTPCSTLHGFTDSFRKRENVHSNTTGLTVFKCGHAYHVVCLQSHGYKCPKNCLP